MDKLNIYLSQDIDNPDYLFHGSPKRLEILKPQLATDSNDNYNNIAEAIFLFPSFLKCTPYAFKDTIIKKSYGLDWCFEIPNSNSEKLMTMQNVRTDDEMIGYVYVFQKNGNMLKDEKSYQYKCYTSLIPIDVIEVKYGDYKQYFDLVDANKKMRWR